MASNEETAKAMSLRGFIAKAEQLGELHTVRGAHWDTEIGGITEIVAEQAGPALLFDEIVGYPSGFRVFSNPFGSVRRTAIALGLAPDLDGVGVLEAWRHKLREFTPGWDPVEAAEAPWLHHRYTGRDVDLGVFPTPKWHAGDGGRYIGTGDAVITTAIDHRWVNVGAYRAMIIDQNHVTLKFNKGKHGRLHLDEYRERGMECPVVVVLGTGPGLWAAASTGYTPFGVSEYAWAGWLAGKPSVVVRGPLTGLPIPYDAEAVLEGWVELPERVTQRYVEGPFGEWLGYYADVTENVVPLMRVEAVYYRDDPILLGVPPLKPPAPWHFAVPLVGAAVWDALEQAGIPGVRGVWMHGIPGGPMFLVIAIHQQYAGHARQAGLVATGSRAGAYGGRFTVVVDDDIDITNAQEVLWALSTRCRIEQDLDIVRDLWQTPADPTLTRTERDHERNVAARAIIDACRPYGTGERFAAVSGLDARTRAALKQKWNL